jgi:hypothetical protein
MNTSRTQFNETWLTEMPEGLGKFEMFDMLKYNINDMIKHNQTIIDLGNNLKKIELQQSVYYWYGQSNEVLLGAELSKASQGWIVQLVGKNPKIRGRAPFASDLYNAILQDTKSSIRILSDKQLSDEGFEIWKRLFQQGHKISVYDNEAPGKTFKTFDTIEELNQYIQNDNSDFKRYQYVLTENSYLAETRNNFNNRRYRELAGLSLLD